jgi:L-fuconolactonase
MAERGPDMSRFLPIRPDWLNLAIEPVLEPDLPIIDAHHHLWDFGGFHYMFDELLGDVTGGHNVIATVYAQCSAMYRASGPEPLRPVGETEFVNGFAAMSASGLYGPSRLCAGIVGYANLLLGAAVQEVLEAHIAAGGGRFRGIRHSVVWDADSSILSPLNKSVAGMLLDPAYRAGVSRLAPLGLSFEAWLYHPQLSELADLARAFPETTIVVDHLGGPIRIGRYAARRDEGFKDWADGIKQVAACPNVVMKLGGLGMRYFAYDTHEAPLPPGSEYLARLWRPYIETCIDAFGPGRCIFQSNFPVDKASYSYRTGWNAFKRLTAGFSADEKADMFCETARRVYRLAL